MMKESMEEEKWKRMEEALAKMDESIKEVKGEPKKSKNEVYESKVKEEEEGRWGRRKRRVPAGWATEGG